MDWYDYGARNYDAALGRWMNLDPLAEKYPEYSPYVYTYNTPTLFIDPNGMEGIVVSGQPGDHKNKRHFLVNGLDRAKTLQKQYNKDGNGEKATWIIYNNGDSENGGFTDKQISQAKKDAKKAGIDVKVVSDSDEIVSYVNDKNGKNDARSDDLVSDFVYVGHAMPGELSVGYESHSTWDEMTSDGLDPSDFNANAFSDDSNANLVGGCRTAVDPWFGSSAGKKMAEKVGGTVKASDVRVEYPGGVVSDETLVKPNNGSIVTFKGKKKKN